MTHALEDAKKDPDKESARDLIVQIQDRAHELDTVRFRAQGSGGRGLTLVLAVAVVGAVGLLAWDLTHPVETPPAFDEAELVASLEFTVYLTALGIEEYRTRTGQLPETLEEAGLDDPAIAYETEPSGYRIEARAGNHSLTFSDGDDLEALEASFWNLQKGTSE